VRKIQSIRLKEGSIWIIILNIISRCQLPMFINLLIIGNFQNIKKLGLLIIEKLTQLLVNTPTWIGSKLNKKIGQLLE